MSVRLAGINLKAGRTIPFFCRPHGGSESGLSMYGTRSSLSINSARKRSFRARQRAAERRPTSQDSSSDEDKRASTADMIPDCEGILFHSTNWVLRAVQTPSKAFYMYQAKPPPQSCGLHRCNQSCHGKDRRVTLHECLFSISQCTLGSGGRQDLECNVDRRQIWRWTAALDLVNVQVLEAVRTPSGLGLGLALHPVSVSFQRRRRTSREDITRSRCFLWSHLPAWGL